MIFFLMNFERSRDDKNCVGMGSPKCSREEAEIKLHQLVGNYPKKMKPQTGKEIFSPTFPFVLVARSCPTLCDPMDCSPPAPSVHGILQARILEWVAMPFSMDTVTVFTTVKTWKQSKCSLIEGTYKDVCMCGCMCIYIYQPLERMKLCHLWQHEWTLKALY